MPLPSGRYVIANCRTRNLAVLSDGNDGFPLRSRVPGLFDERRGEEWDVTILGNGNYRIQNLDFDSQFAGYNPYPTEKDEVLSKSKPQQWAIKQPFGTSPVCLISPSCNKDLFWGILMDEEDGTPIEMSPISTDRRNHWLFQPIESLQQGSLLDLEFSPSSPMEEISGQIDSQPLSDFLRLMSALETFFTNMTQTWQTTQGNETASSSIVARSSSDIARLLASMVALFAIEHSLDLSVGGYSALAVATFFGIFCQQLSYTIKVDHQVYIIDLFEERVALSSDIWQSWERVHELLKDRQRNRAGSRYVERGDYYIAGEDNQPIVPDKWEAIIKPGMVLEMGIIRQVSSLAGTRRCPRCDTLVVGVSPKGRDIQCTFCPCKFRVRLSSSDIRRWRPAFNNGSLSPLALYPGVYDKRMPEEREILLFSRVHIIFSRKSWLREYLRHLFRK